MDILSLHLPPDAKVEIHANTVSLSPPESTPRRMKRSRDLSFDEVGRDGGGAPEDIKEEDVEGEGSTRRRRRPCRRSAIMGEGNPRGK